MSDRGNHLLAVLRCDGERCAGLHDLQDDRTPGPGCRARLAEAVRCSRRSVLIKVDCLRRCEHGAVVVLGVVLGVAQPGPSRESGGHRLRLGPESAVLVQTELPERAEALEQWLRTSPGSLAGLPVALAVPQL